LHFSLHFIYFLLISIQNNAIKRLGNPTHLKNVRELGSFIGLTPRERFTGEVVKRGQITHLGDKNLRRLLIEAA